MFYNMTTFINKSVNKLNKRVIYRNLTSKFPEQNVKLVLWDFID